MSIDLYVKHPRPFALGPLLPKIAEVLAEMLGLPTPPVLALEELNGGGRRPASTDVVADQSSRSFLVSIAGELETVGLNVPGDCVSLIMGARRTCLEYALGAAIAIALARRSAEVVEDPWRFYSERQEVDPDELLERMRIDGPSTGYREASEKLRDRLPI